MAAAEEPRILGERNRLRLPGRDGKTEALHQNRLIQSRFQTTNGHLLLQTHELHRPRRLL